MASIIEFPRAQQPCGVIAGDPEFASISVGHYDEDLDRPEHGRVVVDRALAHLGRYGLSFRAYDLTPDQASRLLGLYQEMSR